MDGRIAFVGAFVLVLGIMLIGVSRISYEKEGYWHHGDGTVTIDTDSTSILFEKNDRWTIENFSYLLWISGSNQSLSLPTDDFQVSLYDNIDNMVAQVSYGNLSQMPTGLPVPHTGLYTIKIENIDESNTISATFVRLVQENETIFPYNYLLSVGIPVVLVGAGTAICGAVKRSPVRKKTRQKSA